MTEDEKAELANLIVTEWNFLMSIRKKHPEWESLPNVYPMQTKDFSEWSLHEKWLYLQLSVISLDTAAASEMNDPNADFETVKRKIVEAVNEIRGKVNWLDELRS